LSYLRVPEFSVRSRATASIRTAGSLGALVTEAHQEGWTRTSPPRPTRSASLRHGAVQLGFQRVISFDYDRSIQQVSGLRTIAQKAASTLSPWRRAAGVPRRAFGIHAQPLAERLRTGVRAQPDQPPGSPVRDFRFSAGTSTWRSGRRSRAEPGAVWKTSFDAEVELSRSRTDLDAQPSPGHRSHSSDDVTVNFPTAFGFGASWRPSSRSRSRPTTRAPAGPRAPSQLLRAHVAAPPVPATGGRVRRTAYPSLTDSQVDTNSCGWASSTSCSGRVRWPLRAGFFTDASSCAATIRRGTNTSVPSLYGVSGAPASSSPHPGGHRVRLRMGDYYQAPLIERPRRARRPCRCVPIALPFVDLPPSPP